MMEGSCCAAKLVFVFIGQLLAGKKGRGIGGPENVIQLQGNRKVVRKKWKGIKRT